MVITIKKIGKWCKKEFILYITHLVALTAAMAYAELCSRFAISVLYALGKVIVTFHKFQVLFRACARNLFSGKII